LRNALKPLLWKGLGGRYAAKQWRCISVLWLCIRKLIPKFLIFALTMTAYKILLYYCYTRITEPETFAAEHLEYCKKIGLKGRIIVADEGINGTVSGPPEACLTYMQFMKADERFATIDFKIDTADEHVFQKMHVRYKPEIVHLGVREKTTIDPTKRTGKYLSPKEFLSIKDNSDVVVVDMRSDYEYELGKFKNAITLGLENFRDLPRHLHKLEQYKDKKIITYCTGGIKCEKASALLLEHGFEDVYQLHGGVVKYAQETGGVDFDGELYVFDGRIKIEVNTVNPVIISRCFVCGTPSPRMVNCANPECNIHTTICEKCGIDYDGACSIECKEHPRKRPYNDKGYYPKPAIEYN
jgi:UPF0176 protein